MDGLDRQVLAAVRRWHAEGHRCALVTVARTWGSSPRPPGAWLALRDDGTVQGSVSGGCVEDDLIERMRAGRLTGTQPFPLTYGVSRAEAERFGLPCGGTLELVVEPNPDPVLLADLDQRIGAGRRVRRVVDLGRGLAHLEEESTGEDVEWDGGRLSVCHGPRWRLLIIGTGQISAYLAQMAQALDYQVFVCDPRVEYSREWRVHGVPWVPGMPDDVVQAFQPDPHTAIVALTHDPKLDDLALLEALESPAFYVGALGSRANSARRRERLATYFELSREALARLHGPVGLPIGSRTPPEIAVAILAEMTAVKRLGPTGGTGRTEPVRASSPVVPGCAVS